MKKEIQKKKSGIRVQWKLLAFLLAFVAFILAVIWVFQIQMLGNFYKNAKYRELETISGILEKCLETDRLGEAVESCAQEYDTCIRIFKRTQGNVFVEAASADVASDCTIHHLSEEKLQYYYNQTLLGEGSYTENKELPHNLGEFWSEGEIKLFEVFDRDEKIYGIVHNLFVTAEGGTQYMVMLNSVLTPLKPQRIAETVKTLKMQFSWICLVLLVGAILLAFLISRNISRPLVEMNKAAKQLARGHYDADFKGTGYREICELGDSLNYASSELSKVDSLQRELIANVSHDLRTPLTLIKGYGEMMRDIREENTPENIQVIIDETTYLSDLVTDLLDLSKLRAGSRKPVYEIFDLTEMTKEVMERYDRLVGVDGYDISFEYDANAAVYADRRMLLQVIYNLINNAVNYAGEDKRVRVVQTVKADTVRISVMDNGEGIAPEDIALIWDRYYRVDANHKRSVVGSGLGLSIVKGILELHGAHYGVESAKGHGSTFWFEVKSENVENAEGKTNEE